MKIKYLSTLFYYDGPQIFEARDSDYNRYIAVMIESDDHNYMVVKINFERLNLFKSGKIDLLSLLLDNDKWYLGSFESLDGSLEIILQNSSLKESPYLPDPLFVIK